MVLMILFMAAETVWKERKNELDSCRCLITMEYLLEPTRRGRHNLSHVTRLTPKSQQNSEEDLKGIDSSFKFRSAVNVSQ